MKRFFTLTLILFASIKMMAQGAYDDLRVMYVEENYEKCYKKCMKYLEDDEAKRHALPYFYFAATNYRLSQSTKFADDYPNAAKDAISYAGKFTKKDKKGDYADYDLKVRFFEELKMDLAEQIENYWIDGTEKGYKKAVGILKKTEKIDPTDAGVALLRGIAEIKTGNKTEGKKLTFEGYERVKTTGVDVAFEDLSASTQYFYRMSLMYYAKFRVESKDPSGALEVLTLGHSYFYEDNDEYKHEYNGDFRTLYDELNQQ